MHSRRKNLFIFWKFWEFFFSRPSVQFRKKENASSCIKISRFYSKRSDFFSFSLQTDIPDDPREIISTYLAKKKKKSIKLIKPNPTQVIFFLSLIKFINSGLIQALLSFGEPWAVRLADLRMMNQFSTVNVPPLTLIRNYFKGRSIFCHDKRLNRSQALLLFFFYFLFFYLGSSRESFLPREKKIKCTYHTIM